MKRLLLSVTLAGCVGLFDHPAQAASELLQLLEVLRQNRTITEDQYQRLRDEAQANQQQQEETQTQIQEQVQVLEEERNKLPKISTKGGLSIESTDPETGEPDGKFKFGVGGRIMVDSAWYNSDGRSLGSGSEFRRARIKLDGTLFYDWDFRLQYDFADTGNVVDGIKDAYIRYNGFKPARITVGNQKEPFSLEALTSSRFFTFMEPALPVLAFSPGRNIGVAADYRRDNGGVAAGVYGEGVDNSETGKSSGWGAAARGHFAPIADKERRRYLHLGAAVAFRAPNADNDVSYSTRPESHVTNVSLVDTGTIEEVNNSTNAGFELAGVLGPFSVQGEGILNYNNRKSGFRNVNFNGWYAYASYFLTGESRNYDPKSGTFGRITPNRSLFEGGWGAWELATRYSRIDLNSKDIEGGTEDNLTVGVNWYPNRNTRFMANFIKAWSNKGSPSVKDNPYLFQLRAQVDF